MKKPNHVTGIGGIFFKCKDPAALRQWYADHLGMEVNQYGCLFKFSDEEKPDRSMLQWSVMPEDTKHYAPSTQPFMINYRVNHLAPLLEELKEAGVEIVGEMEEYEYGKFGWVMDPEGNKIELWEPADDSFSEE